MTETFILYYGLVILCWIFAKLEVKYNNSFWLVSLLIIYSIFTGFKYSISPDFQSYLSHYQRVYDGNEWYIYFEEGYLVFNRILAYLRIPPAFFFIILNFIFISAVCYITKKTCPKSLPWVIIIFIMMDYGFSISTNIYRQYLAFSIFTILLPTILLPVRYIYIFILSCFFVAFIHKSAIVGLFFLLFVNRKFITKDNRIIWIIAIGIIYLFSSFLAPALTNIFRVFSNILGYGETSYLDSTRTVSFRGLGVFLKYIQVCVAIWFYPKIICVYKNKLIDLIFNVFLVGSLVKAFIFNNLVLLRTLLPFIAFEYLTIGITIHYIFTYNKKMSVIAIGLILSYLVLFWSYILNSINWMSPYILFKNLYG